MPALPRLRIGPLADVAARAESLAAEPARAMLERAERLADRVDPERLYPLSAVLADLHAARPAASNRDDDDSAAVGAALLADLPALVERLCVVARLDPRDYTGPEWLDAAALCKRWGISRSTLDRYRKRGLIGRRIEPRAGRPKLVFAANRVDAFETRHRPGLDRAGGFTRISAAEAARMVRRAARYQRALGWSHSRAAERIAVKFGRSHEAVRQLLLRRASKDAAPAPPVHARERELIARAARAGVPTERLAKRFDRSEGSIYRSLVLAHAERLIALRLEPAPWEDAPKHFEAPGAPKTLLDHAIIQTNLGRAAPPTLAALLALVEADEPITPAAERTLAHAHAFLRHRAAALIAQLPRHNPPRSAPDGMDAALAPNVVGRGAGGGGGAGVDEIETILRWAARLKAELVRSQLPLAVRTVEAAAERPFGSLSPSQVAGACELAIGTLSEAVEKHDPFRAGRIAAQAGLALNRSIAAWWRSTHAPIGARPGAARPRPTPPELVTIPDFTVALCPWQRDLDLAPRLRAALSSAPEPARTLITHRMGWQVSLPDGTTIGGGPPRSLAQIAAAMNKPVWRIARVEGDGVRTLLSAARSKASPVMSKPEAVVPGKTP